MVIPLGGGGGDDGGMGGMMAPQIGPPPDFLLARFKKIKVCLVAMIISIVLQLGAGIPLTSDVYNLILNVLNAVLIVIVGIFLLKDDSMFSGAYECLVSTFCSGCRDQCQGGMPCLCSWFFVCLLSAALSLIPIPGSQIYVIVDGFRLIFDATFTSQSKWNYAERSTPWYVLFSIYLVSQTLLLIAQMFGAYHGFKGFRDMQSAMSEGGDFGGGVTGGGYGDPYSNQGGDRFGGGGQRLGGDGGGGQQQQRMASGNVATVSGGQARSPPLLFSGQGQRLGS
jgi:hypothetical protein